MYTKRDYPVLNQLMTEYGPEGFVVLGFPTDQFSNQEPGDESEILNCLAHVRPGGNFVPNFPMMSKSDVNGRNENALWTWMKRLCPLPTTFSYGSIRWTPVQPYDISWNFEKYLIDRAGNPCRRYDSSVSAADLRNDIASVLRIGCSHEPVRCSISGARRV